MNAQQMLETEALQLMQKSGSHTPTSLTRNSMVTRHSERYGRLLRTFKARGWAVCIDGLNSWRLTVIAPTPTEDAIKQLNRACIKNIAHRESLLRCAINDSEFAL